MGSPRQRTSRQHNDQIRITRRITIPKTYLRDPRDVSNGARYHPQRHNYTAAIIHRARAHHAQTPYAVIGGWAAVAYAGLKLWVDDAHITLHVNSNFQQAHNPLDATRRRLRPDAHTWNPDREHPTMRVMIPEIALIDCLIDLQRNRHSWWVYQVPGLAAWEVRAIQLIDALRQNYALNFTLVRKIARHIFNARVLKRLLKLSSSGAQSPPESVLRLIAERIREHLRVQIPVHQSGSLTDDGSPLLTVLDAGWADIHVALFYDGEHHLQRQQRDYDSQVFIRLRELNWEPLRITHGLLRKPDKLMSTLRHAIARAEQAQTKL